MSENKTSPQSFRRPTVVATLVLIAGAAASVAINLKAVSLGQAPEMGAYVSGIAWPLALFGAIELLVHTPWAKTAGDKWIKGGVLVIVAGVAAWVSYWHGAHVLSHWGYDEVSRYAGPLVADAAMGLATLALQRVASAKRLAKDALATVATLANPAPVATVATPLPLAKPAEVATVASLKEPTLAEDWADLDTSWDEELAAMTTAGQAEPTEPAAAATPEAAQDATTASAAAALTKVPAEAAKRIQEILAEDASATGVAIGDALVAAGLAGSTKTGRRWAAAIKNNSARVA